MKIPSSGRSRWVAELVEECLVSQNMRATKAEWCQNLYYTGGDNASEFALYNKTFAYIDDLISLLYSPLGLRYTLGDESNMPSMLDIGKHRAAATKLRSLARQASNEGMDTVTSDAVEWSLVEGKSIVKLNWNRGRLQPSLVRQDMFGVWQENLTSLDSNMEAFVHCQYMTAQQFLRRIWAHPNKDELARKMKRYLQPSNVQRRVNAMPIVVGGLYPFQPGGTPASGQRGIVDWMSPPSPQLAAQVAAQLVRFDELWVWDDERRDWSTFQQVGKDMMVLGEDFSCNALAWDPETKQHNKYLTGHHPFIEFCPNRTRDYFWGRSELVLVAGLQYAINSRINGINGLLRLQEDKPKFFSGATTINQAAISRFKKPGGWLSDSGPNAKMQEVAPEIGPDLWESIHEYERMFDELGGLPPIAKGRGESGVRSGGHAETLVRMFSPRFKDRALLVENSCASEGALALDLARAHCSDPMIAWTSQQDSPVEGEVPNVVVLMPPVPGQVQTKFKFADLPDNVVVSIDSHSSSPAFAMEARALIFDLFKIGAADAADVVEHTDAPRPETLIAGIDRRSAQRQAFLAAHPEEAQRSQRRGK